MAKVAPRRDRDLHRIFSSIMVPVVNATKQGHRAVHTIRPRDRRAAVIFTYGSVTVPRIT